MKCNYIINWLTSLGKVNPSNEHTLLLWHLQNSRLTTWFSGSEMWSTGTSWRLHSQSNSRQMAEIHFL